MTTPEIEARARTLNDEQWEFVFDWAAGKVRRTLAALAEPMPAAASTLAGWTIDDARSAVAYVRSLSWEIDGPGGFIGWDSPWGWHERREKGLSEDALSGRTGGVFDRSCQVATPLGRAVLRVLEGGQ